MTGDGALLAADKDMMRSHQLVLSSIEVIPSEMPSSTCDCGSAVLSPMRRYEPEEYF